MYAKLTSHALQLFTLLSLPVASSSNIIKIQDRNDHIIIISTTVGITITAFIIIVVFILTLTIVIRFKSQSKNITNIKECSV